MVLKANVAPVPVNLISGPLGVGKTTVINHLLRHRPEGESWAVLVNEYGLVGLDAALMETSPGQKERGGVEIREVAGGCICCSAGFMFEVSLVLLLQRRPDRLLIEPTGLATLSGILDTLDRPGIREAVDVRSVVCLLDTAIFEKQRRREEVVDQIEAADILLAGRADLAGDDERVAFESWAASLFPAKRFVGHVEKGGVDLALLDLVTGRTVARARHSGKPGPEHRHDHEHAHGHHHDPVDATRDGALTSKQVCDAAQPIVQRAHRSPLASTVGWICWRELVFDAQRVSRWLTRIAQLPGAMRTKAVLRTTDGWWSFNLAVGAEDKRKSAYRRDSRLEVVIEGNAFPDTQELERSLRQCVVSSG